MVRPRVCAAWLFLLFVVLLLPASAAEFPDVPQWHWAWRYVQGVSDADIATGYWNGDYRPDEVVTRGQMAVFVARAMRGGEAGVPEASGAATFGDVPPTVASTSSAHSVPPKGRLSSLTMPTPLASHTT